MLPVDKFNKMYMTDVNEEEIMKGIENLIEEKGKISSVNEVTRSVQRDQKEYTNEIEIGG